MALQGPRPHLFAFQAAAGEPPVWQGHRKPRLPPILQRADNILNPRLSPLLNEYRPLKIARTFRRWPRDSPYVLPCQHLTTIRRPELSKLHRPRSARNPPLQGWKQRVRRVSGGWFPWVPPLFHLRRASKTPAEPREEGEPRACQHSATARPVISSSDDSGAYRRDLRCSAKPATGSGGPARFRVARTTGREARLP
jgi:hypothetical protein